MQTFSKDMTAMRTIFSLLFCLALQAAHGQTDSVFKGYYYNNVYQVYLRLNFYDEDVLVEGQELFGTLPGYLGSKRDARKWLFTSAEVKGQSSASLAITNDYGSEDLTATLRRNADGSLTLRQESGSRIKIAVDRKWVKLPTELRFEKQADKTSLE